MNSDNKHTPPVNQDNKKTSHRDVFLLSRRSRDLNPGAAINDLLPFQGSPFGQLGYFSLLARITNMKYFTRFHL